MYKLADETYHQSELGVIKLKHSLFWLLLVFILPISAFAQTGTIEGTVYNQNTGKPLTGAEVHILETDERQKTDANGNFQFTGIPIGTYQISVSKPNALVLGCRHRLRVSDQSV